MGENCHRAAIETSRRGLSNAIVKKQLRRRPGPTPLKENIMAKIHQDKIAIVTGGARGIGLGIAKRLQKDGAKVAIWDLGFDSFDPEVAGFRPDYGYTVNVADLGSVAAACAATKAAQESALIRLLKPE
jgi:hypothetical protein